MNLQAIQAALRDAGLDGWLFFDHHLRDPLAYRVLGLKTAGHVTRRWYYFIPAEGEPRGLVHGIESGILNDLPGPKTRYADWRRQHAGLRDILGGARRVAMQFSPLCAVPYVANVDAGTVDLVRAQGVEVVSSAELIQLFEARWTPAMLEMHLEAGRRMDRVRAEAFEHVAQALSGGTAIDEFSVQQFVLRRMTESKLITDCAPIVGVNANASNPHYAPSAADCAPVRRGDLLLLDMWAKLDDPDAAYYDITWMAFCGQEPPARMREVFDIVAGARDAGIRFVQDSVTAGRTIRGFEVDDVVRGHIAGHQLAEYFYHRTGHSIGRECHGNGANMDNLETHDERIVMARSCFSVEPGVYLPEFGVRSEVDVYVDERSARVTGEKQTELICLAAG